MSNDSYNDYLHAGCSCANTPWSWYDEGSYGTSGVVQSFETVSTVVVPSERITRSKFVLALPFDFLLHHTKYHLLLFS